MGGFRTRSELVAAGILEPDPNYSEHAKMVGEFLRLQSKPNVPRALEPQYRNEQDFTRVLSLLPDRFFAPFDEVAEALGVSKLLLAPDEQAVQIWNSNAYRQKLVRAVEAYSDDESGPTPDLFPRLVDAWQGLNWESEVEPDDWPQIQRIAVAGGRNIDRATEALRSYIRLDGVPELICSGKAPSWDPKGEIDGQVIDITEAGAVRAFWRMHGVPDRKIKIETNASSTAENANFLVSMLDGCAGATLFITSPFHLARFRLGLEMKMPSEAKRFYRSSRSNKYMEAESFFFTDPKAGYQRHVGIHAALTEYLKIAHDVCVESYQQPEPAIAA